MVYSACVFSRTPLWIQIHMYFGQTFSLWKMFVFCPNDDAPSPKVPLGSLLTTECRLMNHLCKKKYHHTCVSSRPLAWKMYWPLQSTLLSCCLMKKMTSRDIFLNANTMKRPLLPCASSRLGSFEKASLVCVYADSTFLLCPRAKVRAKLFSPALRLYTNCALGLKCIWQRLKARFVQLD